MEVRDPAVSGTFYPGDEKELKTMIHNCFMHPVGPGKLPTTDTNQKIYGVICPHAGFVSVSYTHLTLPTILLV